jgi:hypothetical protein
MSNAYIFNPIKFNILDKYGIIKERIVVIGNAHDDRTVKELKKIAMTQKIPKSIQAEAILREVFGSKWKSNLGLTLLEIKGGDDLGLTLLEIKGGHRGVSNVVDDNEVHNDETKVENDDQDFISIEEIDAITNILNDESDVIDKSDVIDTNQSNQSNQVKPKKVKVIPQIKFIFEECSIYPNDTILEVKKKIMVMTGIPIYKQNLWYKRDKKIHNLWYNLFIQNNVVNLSLLNNVINGNQKNIDMINDIPILNNFYNVKNRIEIKCYDTFTIMENITQTITVNEFNIFNLDDFINIKFDKDVLTKSQLEIIYYGFIILFWPMFSLSVWLDYINDFDTFEKSYPDLSGNLSSLKRRFHIEQKITDSAINLKYSHDKEEIEIRDRISKNLYIGITSSTLVVRNNLGNNVLNLRNIFDKISLNKNIVSCKCSIFHERNIVLLNKTFINTEQIRQQIPNKCIVLRITTTDNNDNNDNDNDNNDNNDNTDTMDIHQNNLYLYIFPNGHYLVKAKWLETDLYNFKKIFDTASHWINPIILMLNKMGNTVINSLYQLETMSMSNTTFSEISASLIYRNPLKYDEFLILKNILQEYSKGGIIRNKNVEISDPNTLNYYFDKGMYRFDERILTNTFIIKNQYAFLTSPIIKKKWIQVFEETRQTDIVYRHNDIKISIDGIKEKEFNIFYMYIMNLFYTLDIKKDLYKKSDDNVSFINGINPKSAKSIMSIRSLKNQDPILYNYRGINDDKGDNDNVLYSRLCQKPFQPKIVNDNEYEKLPNYEKKLITKYWNFTTKKPVYYKCPNPKYPHLGFITKKHPNNYCMPCCKKSPDTDKEIHELCLKEHIYDGEKKNYITNYIMTYGSKILTGRLYNLPESSLEPLLYESIYESESNCKLRFYIYGIDQNIKYTRNVGYLTTLAFSLDLPLNGLIDLLIESVTNNIISFNTLLGGQILKYFKNHTDFINKVETNFNSDIVFDNGVEIPWNDIFMDISYLYMDIISVVFDDQTVMGNENIKLNITKQLSHLRNSENETNINKNINKKYMFLLKKNNNYNPIYRINYTDFFNKNEVYKKLFKISDPIVDVLKDIYSFEIDLDLTYKEINVDTYQEFVASHSKSYKITKYFVNNQNMCYYIEFENLKQTNCKEDNCKDSYIYIPVKFSNYHMSNDIQIDYSYIELKKTNTNFNLLNKFIKDFNAWIGNKEAIRVDKWIYLSNPWDKNNKPCKTPIIGFIYDNINYYHEPLSLEYAKQLKNAPLERILYHPDMINKQLVSTNIVPDPRTKNIVRNTYDYHLYELFILEFTTLFNKERNISLRNNIKKLILKFNDFNIQESIKKIHDLIHTFYTKNTKVGIDTKNIVNINYSAADTNKINNIINRYIITHKDKKVLINEIETTIFVFDKIKLDYFREMPTKKLIAELTKISKSIIVIVSDSEITNKLTSISNFSNIYISCQDHDQNTNLQESCKKNKLMINANKFKELIQILAADIKNSFKSKWLFESIFTGNIINFFRFERHPNEIITISIESAYASIV